MSHFLSHVSVRNFKCIKNTALELDHVTPLVGQNNAGKSTILTAIQWLVKPVSIDDSWFSDKTAEIVIEATIEGMTTDLIDKQIDQKHAVRIKKFIANNQLKIRRVMPPGETRVAAAKLWILDPVTNIYEENPTGISAAIQDLFPDAVRIEAMTDAHADAATNKTTTTLGKLISQLAAPIANDHKDEIDMPLKRLEDLLSADGAARSAKLVDFDRQATSAVQDFFPGLSLTLHFPTPLPPDLFKNGTVKVSEGANSQRNFNELGHGAQRAIQMALIRLLAKRVQTTADSPRCTLLLIDEPELYLHPHAIEQVRIALSVLALHGYQVIFSTHSPLMIGRRESEVTNIVVKPSQAIGTVVNTRAKDAIAAAYLGSEAPQARTLFELNNSKEIWFSRKLLLVEGHSEHEIMSYLYESVMGRTLAAQQFGIVKLSGSGDMVKSLGILTNMGLGAGALVDLDYAFKQGGRTGLIPNDHPARQAVISWFSSNTSAHGFDLDEEGLPKKTSRHGTEGSYKIMAQDPLNDRWIEELHTLLQKSKIWLWRTGCLEDILGIRNKNDRQEVATLCNLLADRQFPATLNQQACTDFFNWFEAN